MFVMSDEPEFAKEATGKMPGDDGEAFSFKATFVALGSTEQKTFDLSTEEGTAAFLRRVLRGIADVLDGKGNPVPFTNQARDWLIDQAHTRAALVKAYFGGVYEASLGN